MSLNQPLLTLSDTSQTGDVYSPLCYINTADTCIQVSRRLEILSSTCIYNLSIKPSSILPLQSPDQDNIAPPIAFITAGGTHRSKVVPRSPPYTRTCICVMYSSVKYTILTGLNTNYIRISCFFILMLRRAAKYIPYIRLTFMFSELQ